MQVPSAPQEKLVIVRVLLVAGRDTTESPSVYGSYERAVVVVAEVLGEDGGDKGRTVDDTPRSAVGHPRDDRCQRRIGQHGRQFGGELGRLPLLRRETRVNQRGRRGGDVSERGDCVVFVDVLWLRGGSGAVVVCVSCGGDV